MALTRELGDSWRLSQLLGYQAYVAIVAGDPITAPAAAEEGYALADAIGDHVNSGQCGQGLGWALLMQGELAAAVAQFGSMAADASDGRAANSEVFRPNTLQGLGISLSYQGEVAAARVAGHAAIEAGAELGDFQMGMGDAAIACAELAAGNATAAYDASERARQRLSTQPYASGTHCAHIATRAALAIGDVSAARRYADDAIAATVGWHQVTALLTRARVSIAEDEPAEAERDAYDALVAAAGGGTYVALPDILEITASLGAEGNPQHAARLFAAAEAMRLRMGAVRFKIYDADYAASVAALRNAMDHNDFDTAWAEGAALSTDEVIAYAQRGRGERKRASSGWASLTPAETDVVRLVCEGLGNKVYTKLGIGSRVQLVQEAARNG